MARVRNREEFPIDDPFNESVSAPNSRYVRSWISITLGENSEEHTFRPIDAQSLARRALRWDQHILGGQITNNTPTGCRNSRICRRIEGSECHAVHVLHVHCEKTKRYRLRVGDAHAK